MTKGPEHNSPNPENTNASSLGGYTFEENYEKGKILRFPSIDVKLSIMDKVFPEIPKTAEEVAHGFHSTFPEALVLSLPEDEPHEVIVELEKHYANGEDQPPTYSMVYAAVDEVGSVPHHNDVEERYVVTNGELIVSTKEAEDPIVHRLMARGAEITLNPGVIHAAKAKSEWAVFQTSSTPGWTPEGHIIASNDTIEEFNK